MPDPKHGHEYNTARENLQHACIFALEGAAPLRACACDSAFTTAKAHPGLREIAALHDYPVGAAVLTRANASTARLGYRHISQSSSYARCTASIVPAPCYS